MLKVRVYVKICSFNVCVCVCVWFTLTSVVIYQSFIHHRTIDSIVFVLNVIKNRIKFYDCGFTCLSQTSWEMRCDRNWFRFVSTLYALTCSTSVGSGFLQSMSFASLSFFLNNACALFFLTCYCQQRFFATGGSFAALFIHTGFLLECSSDRSSAHAGLKNIT